MRISSLAVVLCAILTVMNCAIQLAQAQNNPRAIPGARGAGNGAPPNVDPATGLPMPEEPAWQEPDKKLTSVAYDGLPIEEVARDLRKQFDEAFDIVLPNNLRLVQNANSFQDPLSTPVKIQLKNVSASEVFNAMNLMFETENAPLHWQLKMNGSRPMVVLRVTQVFLGSTESPRRRIYFVGELLGDEKSGGMTMEQLVKTVSEVYEMSYGTSRGALSEHLQFHKQAQLLIATGTLDEINFITETLAALRQKLEHQPKAKTGGGGGGGGGGNAAQKATNEQKKAP